MSWDDPSLAQIWFRGGADYIIPRADVGIFTLGSRPRDADRCREIDALADRALDVLQGRSDVKVREIAQQLALDHPTSIRLTAMSGRCLIRWDASNIWLIGCERPDIDDEDARLALARRFLRWFAPQSKDRLAWWAGLKPRDATQTWNALSDELVLVDLDTKKRAILATDVDALLNAEPVEGLRLIHNDDPYVKEDRSLLVDDERLRGWVFPRPGQSPGYIPGAIVVDGEIAGVWQRQQRRGDDPPVAQAPPRRRRA